MPRMSTYTCMYGFLSSGIRPMIEFHFYRCTSDNTGLPLTLLPAVFGPSSDSRSVRFANWLSVNSLMRPTF